MTLHMIAPTSIREAIVFGGFTGKLNKLKQEDFASGKTNETHVRFEVDPIWQNCSTTLLLFQEQGDSGGILLPRNQIVQADVEDENLTKANILLQKLDQWIVGYNSILDNLRGLENNTNSIAVKAVFADRNNAIRGCIQAFKSLLPLEQAAQLKAVRAADKYWSFVEKPFQEVELTDYDIISLRGSVLAKVDELDLSCESFLVNENNTYDDIVQLNPDGKLFNTINFVVRSVTGYAIDSNEDNMDIADNDDEAFIGYRIRM